MAIVDLPARNPLAQILPTGPGLQAFVGSTSPLRMGK
jgi:hypothetical protein